MATSAVASSSKPVPMSCKSWTYPETQALLDIWQQDHIQTQLTLMARNRPVWEQVAEVMQYRKGFNRTGEQCKTRIHTLKIRYNRAKKFGLSGPDAEKECPFYRQLDAVLGKNWPRKQDVQQHQQHIISQQGVSPPAITSLYPLTFSNDIDKITQAGMIQILPKPVPKYIDNSLKMAGNLKLSPEKLEDMMGEHSRLIKRIVSTFGSTPKLEGGADDGARPVAPMSDADGFDEILKSLIATSPTALSSLLPTVTTPTKTTFNGTSPSSGSPHSHNADTTPTGPVVKRRKTDTDESSVNVMGSDRVAETMTVIVSHITELNKNLKLAQNRIARKINRLRHRRLGRRSMSNPEITTSETRPCVTCENKKDLSAVAARTNCRVLCAVSVCKRAARIGLDAMSTERVSQLDSEDTLIRTGKIILY
eukprot:sb/3465021/